MSEEVEEQDVEKALHTALVWMAVMKGMNNPMFDMEQLSNDIKMIEDILAEPEEEELVKVAIIKGIVTRKSMADVFWRTARELMDGELGMQNPEVSPIEQMLFLTTLQLALASDCEEIILIPHDDEEPNAKAG